MLLRALTLLLVAVTACLAPLAQASPPDQTWISGWYDNADYDDVVVSITSTTAAAETAPLATVVVRAVSETAAVSPPAPLPPRVSAPREPRAPPAA